MPFIRREDVVTPEEYAMGGKPSKGTPADGRLGANRSKAAAKPAAAKSTLGSQALTKAVKGAAAKTGGKSSPASRRGY